jgi:hypothetical protein
MNVMVSKMTRLWIVLIVLCIIRHSSSYSLKARIASSLSIVFINPLMSRGLDDPYPFSRFTAAYNELVKLDNNWDRYRILIFHYQS